MDMALARSSCSIGGGVVRLSSSSAQHKNGKKKGDSKCDTYGYSILFDLLFLYLQDYILLLYLLLFSIKQKIYSILLYLLFLDGVSHHQGPVWSSSPAQEAGCDTIGHGYDRSSCSTDGGVVRLSVSLASSPAHTR